MSDYNANIMFFNGSVAVNDRVLTYEKKGVKRIKIKSSSNSGILNRYIMFDNTILSDYSFPILGKSLPCVFTVTALTAENVLTRISIEEYDALPDPDYFNIIDLDEDGLPIYADTVSEANSIQLYKKPIINGNTLGDRVLLKTVDNTPENRMLYKIQEPVEIAES